jgi:hypothetical protein
MRAGDFKPCALCGKGVMHTQMPLFYRVRIERMGIDLDEVRRTDAMEKFFGGHVRIARAFQDPVLATPIGEAAHALVCEKCATQPHWLAELAERASSKPNEPPITSHEPPPS